ncbi:hypothetical protein [Brevibacterium marinum]|uniref:Recombination DNA repair RAD52 pathway protein n=1 Tax=Brevibacterium marinum TaxID=418643 RepID=A0A846S454_9MICO|nr:hypothetical protein [Brevibacterium marinum]NJC56891.1 recombination DNA repair RAD52 pathway protein [Brevibacterium marinum]
MISIAGTGDAHVGLAPGDNRASSDADDAAEAGDAADEDTDDADEDDAEADSDEEYTDEANEATGEAAVVADATPASAKVRARTPKATATMACARLTADEGRFRLPPPGVVENSEGEVLGRGAKRSMGR